MRKIFMTMVVVLMALAMSTFAMEPTGPPGDEALMAGSNLYMDIATVQMTGVIQNHKESAPSLYAVTGSNPGMLVALMCGSIFILTSLLMDKAKDEYLSTIGHSHIQFVG